MFQKDQRIWMTGWGLLGWGRWVRWVRRGGTWSPGVLDLDPGDSPGLVSLLPDSLMSLCHLKFLRPFPKLVLRAAVCAVGSLPNWIGP